MWELESCLNSVVGRQRVAADKNKKWFSEGIRFECQGSGNCCSSRGEYGYVYMSHEDRVNAAKFFRISEDNFIKAHCQNVDGFYALKDNPAGPDCIFLKDKKCSIYAARPTQCRTWPFWPETMSAKKWKKDIESFCPGVNKGRLYSEEEITATVEAQKLSERKLQEEELFARSIKRNLSFGENKK